MHSKEFLSFTVPEGSAEAQEETRSNKTRPDAKVVEIWNSLSALSVQIICINLKQTGQKMDIVMNKF